MGILKKIKEKITSLFKSKEVIPKSQHYKIFIAALRTKRKKRTALDYEEEIREMRERLNGI